VGPHRRKFGRSGPGDSAQNLPISRIHGNFAMRPATTNSATMVAFFTAVQRSLPPEHYARRFVLRATGTTEVRSAWPLVRAADLLAWQVRPGDCAEIQIPGFQSSPTISCVLLTAGVFGTGGPECGALPRTKRRPSGCQKNSRSISRGMLGTRAGYGRNATGIPSVFGNTSCAPEPGFVVSRNFRLVSSRL